VRGNGCPELEMGSLKFHAAPNPGSGSGILILDRCALRSGGCQGTPDFGLRISGFLRVSGFGFASPIRSKAATSSLYAEPYCQDRGIDDTEQPLTPALSPSEGEREQPRQLWVQYMLRTPQ